MRLFIAINFSDEIKRLLLGAIDELKEQSVSGNFTKSENLHLTFVFIGESGRVTDIKNCIDSVAAERFTLSVGGSGRFGDIWWAGIKKSAELSALADGLQKALFESGFSIDKREFKPHITLAREVKSSGSVTLNVPSAGMTVGRISLMKSERINGRITYTEVYGRKL